MGQLNVEIPDDLLTEAKVKALRSGLKMTEVVRRLLAAYVEGKLVKVRGPNDEG